MAWSTAHWGIGRFDTGRSSQLIGTVTDQQGRYHLECVPIGRQRMSISHLGYETALLSELLVETGKEFTQHVQLREASSALNVFVYD